MMMEDLKKVLLAGVGSVAYTYEKASTMIDEMVEKGKLSVEEGKELTQELKRNIKDTQEKVTQKVMPLTKEDVINIIDSMNLASQEEINELKDRIVKLETKLNSYEGQ